MAIDINNVVFAINQLDLKITALNQAITQYFANLRVFLTQQFNALKLAIGKIKIEVDFKPVLTAINNLSLKVENINNFLVQFKFDVYFNNIIELIGQLSVSIDAINTNFTFELTQINTKLTAINTLNVAIVNSITSFRTQTFIKLEAILTAIKAIKVTVDFAPVLNALANINTRITTIIQAIAALQIGSNNITTIVNNINNEVRNIGGGGSIQDIKDLLEFEFDAAIGDCIDVEAQQATTGSGYGSDDSGGAIVPAEREYSELAPITYNSFASTFIGIHEHLKAVHKDICEIKLEETSCMVLMPDPRAIHQSYDKYLLIYWVLEETPSPKIYHGVTQVPNPKQVFIDALTNPNLAATIWDTYFKDFRRVLGNLYACFWSDEYRYPVSKAYTSSKTEGRKYLNWIKTLTNVQFRTQSNPDWSDKDNSNISIVHAGKALMIRKVCLINKRRHTDEIDILGEFGNRRR